MHNHHYTARAWYEGNEMAEESDFADFGRSLVKAKQWAYQKALDGLRGIVYDQSIEVGEYDPDEVKELNHVQGN